MTVTSTSPFLAAHKDNPVRWRSWGAEALAEAKAANKPVFLSMGYHGCHWCHVLNKEAFNDADIAAQINDNFIPVLVDRDERPELDQVYQSAAQAMRHPGGWPLNIFLTPDGTPFWVAGYQPREDQPDAPSFRRVLSDVTGLWSEPVKASENATNVRNAIEALYNSRPQQDVMNLDIASLRIGQTFDIFFGGPLGQRKFPAVLQQQVLWNAYLRTGMPQFSQLIFTTLDSILFGGLCDHIGGGFFRHTNDERWLEPSFEKMLSDNAQMIEICTLAFQFNRNELSRQRVTETIGWLTREMLVDGAFAIAQAGALEDDLRYYTWSEAEIDAGLVGTFSARFKQVYGITRDGNLAGRNLPRRLGNPPPANEADEALLAKQREMLLASRAKRTAPPVDTRVAADINGLTIAAIARAGQVFDRADWINSAITAFDAVVRMLGNGDRLAHDSFGGVQGAAGISDDYAYMARAALQLWEITGEARFLEKAKAWVAVLDDKFWHAELSGYAQTASDTESPFVRARVLFDNPRASANAIMMTVLTRLALITGAQNHMERASTIGNIFVNEANRLLNMSAGYLLGFEYLINALEVVVVGHKGHARTQELLRAAWSRAMPNAMIVQIEPGAALPDGHPATGKDMVGGQPAAYIVQAGNCGEAITDANALAYTLTLPVQARPQPQQQQRAG